jgi:hypothetical protein
LNLRKYAFSWAILALASASAMVGQQAKSALPSLSAEQIVDKNVAARGGLQAWRAVQTLSLSGKMQAGGNRPDYPAAAAAGRRGANAPPPAQQKPKPQVELPYLMEFKRERKSRVEIQFAGQTAIQVYDGTSGWKLRPFLNRHEVEPYTPDELKAAALQADLDGPLVDYAAKGSKVELDGTEKVEGHDAYRLRLTTKTGQVQRIWIDGQTFLETKMEGAPRRMDGKPRKTEIYLRDFRKVDSVMIPFESETAIIGYKDTHKIAVEKAVVNPKLEDSRFAKLQ